jgi:Ca2+-binding RTX toxin-like protein
LRALPGADSLNGRGGFDFARYKSAPAGVTASLENPSINTGHATGDTYISIEGLQGSDFADVLVGDGASNILVGGVGGDALDGRDGFDFVRYDIGNSGNRGVTANLADATGNTGTAAGDTYTSIEGLVGTRFADRLTGDDAANRLQGQTGNDRLNGGLGNDTIIAGSGNDRLNGGYGNDRLNGESGRDLFIFDTALNAAENIDTIRSFSIKNDTIRLDDAIFAGLTAGRTLAASAFYRGVGAHDADDRIIHNRSTGAVYYDPDGIGGQAQIQFARVDPKLNLKNLDFFVF